MPGLCCNHNKQLLQRQKSRGETEKKKEEKIKSESHIILIFFPILNEYRNTNDSKVTSPSQNA